MHQPVFARPFQVFVFDYAYQYAPIGSTHILLAAMPLFLYAKSFYYSALRAQDGKIRSLNRIRDTKEVNSPERDV